jgi:hypothetical protein
MAISHSVKRASRPKSSQARKQAAPRRTASKRGGTKTPRACFDDLVGKGAGLWSDDEFERFQAWLREGRRGRE